MDDHFLVAMLLFPREIVVIFHAGNNVSSQQFCDLAVNHIMICRSIVPHEIHGCPILLARFAIEGEPGKTT